MTTLGEAFISVKADMGPFTQNLEKEVKRAAESMEAGLSKAMIDAMKKAAADGDKSGGEVGDRIGAGLKRSLGNSKKSPWITIGAAFASMLDDGISALPTEIKAGIVAGIFAALPFVSAGLAGAVTAGAALGAVALGAALAFQFQQVSDRGGQVLEQLRVRATQAATPFGEEMLKALALVERELDQNLGPLLDETFRITAPFLLPLTEGALGGIENFLDGFNSAMSKSEGFVDELSNTFRTLGATVGEAFNILAETGEEGEEGLRDLTFAIADLIIFTARLVAFLTEAYGVFRDIAIIAGGFASISMAIFTSQSEASSKASEEQRVALEGLAAQGLIPVIKLTSEQEQEMRKLISTTDKYSKLTYDLIQNQIDFEAALDKITEALKENGATLDIEGEKGRAVAQSFLNALKEADDAVQSRLKSGEITAQEAIQLYGAEIEQIYALARAARLSETDFDRLYGAIINAATGRLDAQAMGILAIDVALEDSVASAKELLERLKRISSFRLPAQGTRPFSEYAEGGIVHGPTAAVIGEAGSEVVIPLTKPQRAAQLMQQSGLDRMLSAGPTLVYVYIGNEAVDSRMIQIVERNNTMQAQNLAFGARGF